MKKLDLTNYQVNGPEPGKTLPYDVKTSLITLMFNPDLRLGAHDVLAQQKLADKIASIEGEALLEDAEYEKVKAAILQFRGYVQNDAELVRRVLEASEVQVEEKKDA